jgi:hypothetical protein
VISAPAAAATFFFGARKKFARKPVRVPKMPTPMTMMIDPRTRPGLVMGYWSP